MKFCPECGAKQEEENAREVEVIENYCKLSKKNVKTGEVSEIPG